MSAAAHGVWTRPDVARHVVRDLGRGRRETVLLIDGVRCAGCVRSIERALHVKTPCPVPSYYENIKGYEAFHDGKASELSGVSVEGDYVVRFELDVVDATFLHLLALPIAAPVCASAGTTWTREWASKACGARRTTATSPARWPPRTRS